MIQVEIMAQIVHEIIGLKNINHDATIFLYLINLLH